MTQHFMTLDDHQAGFDSLCENLLQSPNSFSLKYDEELSRQPDEPSWLSPENQGDEHGEPLIGEIVKPIIVDEAQKKPEDLGWQLIQPEQEVLSTLQQTSTTPNLDFPEICDVNLTDNLELDHKPDIPYNLSGSAMEAQFTEQP